MKREIMDRNKETKDIPSWTWYNGQFFFQFDEQLKRNPNMTICAFYDCFLKDQQLDKELYHTKNQGTIISLLYGLMVIPKEIWEKTTTNFQFETREKFKIIKSPDNNTIDFLRRFRNALAHANFSIDIGRSIFTFWNETKKTRNFEVEISYKNLGEFITEIGKYYINEVMEKTQ